jgi:ribosomal protein S18 acetylase RimI-like enzyme
LDIQEIMEIIIRPFATCDRVSVVQLWNDCGLVVPWNNPEYDIERKLKAQPELFLIAYSADIIIATIMAGYDGHRGCINYLAVHPQHRRSGIGKQMVAEAENRLRAKGCPKINLQVRSTNKELIQFYKSIGFQKDDVMSLGKRLQSDQ